MEKSRRKPISRTKTTGVLIKRGDAVDFIQGVGGAQYSKEEHEKIQKRDSITFSIALFVIQLFFIILYAIWLDYPAPVAPGENGHMALYPYFRDVNIMIFFGFGFLMTYLRRYAYSAVGYTFLISAIVVQWSVLIEGYFETVKEDDIRFTTRSITVLELLNGLFCAGAVMISYGAVLGKVTPSQLLIMGFVEPIFYWLNIFITIFLLDVIDVGGGMTIHTFGAYFGLAVTWFLTSPQTRESKDNCSSYNSDIFSLAGTLFLWIMWPSFNAAVAKNDLGQLRAVVNTFLAITSSVMGSFFISRLLSEENKFDVVHIQNSTLAGGVVMGVAADLIVTPFGAIICGFVVSIISVLGYKYITPFLAKKLNIQDICGVNNLHGMPGISSCLVGVFVTLGATPEKYGSEYGLLFPKGSDQAGYQAAGLFITLGVAIVGGSFTGLLMARGWRIAGLVSSDFYNDRTFWSNPSDYEHVVDKDTEEESEPHDDEFEMKDFEKAEPKQKKVKKSDSSVKFMDDEEQKEEKKGMKKDKEDTEEIKEKKEKGKKKEKELKEKKEKKEIKNEKKEKENGKDKKKKKKKESSESESKASSSSSSSSDSGSEDK